MAIPLARVHLAMAHSALPGLLPTPVHDYPIQSLLRAPTWTCAVILLSSPPKPSRADAVERRDARDIKAGGSIIIRWPASAHGQQELHPRARVLVCEMGLQQEERDVLLGEPNQQPRRLGREVGRAQTPSGKSKLNFTKH